MRFESLRPDAIRSIKQRWLLKHWNEIRGARDLPRWSDLDPAAVAPVSDALNFLDVVLDGKSMRFRIKYHGKSIGQGYGADCRGKFLDEVLPPPMVEVTLTTYRHAIASALPVFTVSEMSDEQGRLVHYERLLLPFGSDGTRVDGIVGSLETISPAGAFKQRDLMTSVKEAPRYRVCGTIAPVADNPTRMCNVIA